MQKKLFFALTAALLAFGLGTRADNVVTIGNATGTPGSTVTVSVSLDNTDAVSALQLRMAMPDGCKLVEGSAQTGTRATTHSVTVGVKADTLSLLVYSQSMTALTGNSGEVASFQLQLGNQPATLTLAASKLILTDTDGNTLAGSTTSGTLTVLTAKAAYNARTVDFGRVPIRGTYTQQLTINNVGNAPLTVTALDFSAPELSSDIALPFTVEAGGSQTVTLKYAPIVRGRISETLRVVCNSSSKLNTITLVALPYAVNELHVGDASGIADSTVTIPLRVNNMDDISGFQFEFALPAQLQYVDGSFKLSDRKADHQGLATVKGDTLRLIAYSLNDKAFADDDGEIGSFQVKLNGRNSTDLSAYKAILTATIDGKNQDVMSDKYTGRVTIASPVLNATASIDMGATPVTEDAVSTLTISNYGSAPLTVSRVVFDTLQFSVKETLPLTIAAGQSGELTLVYDGQAQRAYNTLMHLYCNDPEQRMWDVRLKGSRFAPNYLSMETPDIYSGDTLKVKVSLSNYDPINGLQFDISYPQQYFTPVEKIVGTSRTDGLSLQARNMPDGTCRYFVYSLSDASVSPADGEIFTFALAPKDSIPAGDYQLSVTNIKLGTPDMADKYAGEDMTVGFKVSTFLLGDVNGDGKVNVVDIMTISQYLREIQPAVFIERAADVNGDKKINVVDIMTLAEIIRNMN